MLESTYFKLKFPEETDLKRWLSERDGEIRIGQNVLFRSSNKSEDWKEKKFHVMGVKEDIGQG
ncbi:hypothetical protein [Fluviicola sp.]|uniref:hypothetical protein n=1 Tax=Fluviicola sp. TaxID=1917219 RepID=UPI003D2D9E2F